MKGAGAPEGEAAWGAVEVAGVEAVQTVAVKVAVAKVVVKVAVAKVAATAVAKVAAAKVAVKVVGETMAAWMAAYFQWVQRAARGRGVEAVGSAAIRAESYAETRDCACPSPQTSYRARS